MLAWTVFVTGDSYNGGVFSTRAGILDTGTGDIIDMEDLHVTVNGRPYQAADENFWGVTFAANEQQLLRDDVHATARATWSAATSRLRTVTTIRPGVECPSLSPDGTRIAFKQAIGGDPNQGWHLSVLDLASGAVTPLAETRSVDDQAAWLSTHHDRVRGAARRGRFGHLVGAGRRVRCRDVADPGRDVAGGAVRPL